jgi:hexosaminidase
MFTTEPFALIPHPQSLVRGDGHFTLTPQTQIYAAPDAVPVAEYLAVLLKGSTGFTFPVIYQQAVPDTQDVIILAAGRPALGAESYELVVSPERVVLHAGDAAGRFYGVQTLRQLLPLAVEAGSPQPGVTWVIPAVTIKDSPRFAWRGLHLDVVRHWFPVSFVKKFIDWMALHKYNVFHWHLTDDQGWRIEIKRYPRLTEVGSRRAATPIPADRQQSDGKPYGGFYTQDEIREVVAYARSRYITVLPEIEMPGHALAALTAYPELGCMGEGYAVWTHWGIAEDVFCAGNEATYTFLENVLAEVLDLFPGEFIHVGGDECPKLRWESCPRCQAAIQRENLKDEHELQSYVIRRIEKFLNAHQRRLIGWDEILEGGLAPNATVMSWRGTEGGIAAATAGHDVVMSPESTCYFDHYQAQDWETEPPAIGGFTPLETVYAFDPVAGVPDDKAGHVLGGQGNTWTEYIPTEAQLEYMVYPRAAALAEALWLPPRQRDYDDFTRRLPGHLQRLDRLGIRYRKP